MVEESVVHVAELLERIAHETVFEEALYLRLGLLLKERKIDPLLGAAYDEATEFYITWKHQGKNLRSDTRLNTEVTHESRERLLLFAQALRNGVTTFSSVDELRERMRSANPTAKDCN